MASAPLVALENCFSNACCLRLASFSAAADLDLVLDLLVVPLVVWGLLTLAVDVPVGGRLLGEASALTALVEIA